MYFVKQFQVEPLNQWIYRLRASASTKYGSGEWRIGRGLSIKKS